MKAVVYVVIMIKKGVERIERRWGLLFSKIG
jgi:hypothetical protein